MANTAWSSSIIDLHEEEAISRLLALQWLNDWEPNNVIFELDSKIVVESIHNNKLNVSDFSMNILDKPEENSMHPKFTSPIFHLLIASVAYQNSNKLPAFHGIKYYQIIK